MWDALEMGKRSEDSPARSRDNGDEELQMALDRLSRDAFEMGLPPAITKDPGNGVLEER